MRIIISFFLFTSVLWGQNLTLLRKSLGIAPNNKAICEQMIHSVPVNTDSPVFLAYLGAYQTILANHLVNPFSKLSTFKKGKKKIERAINMDNSNLEIRILRYSIQKKSPKFLGYSNNLKEDKRYIESQRNRLKSLELNNLLNNIL